MMLTETEREVIINSCKGPEYDRRIIEDVVKILKVKFDNNYFV